MSDRLVTVRVDDLYHVLSDYGERSDERVPLDPGVWKRMHAALSWGMRAREFGNVLARYRETHNIDHRQAAKAMGVTRACVLSIEKGERPVTPDQAAAWAKALGMGDEEWQ